MSRRDEYFNLSTFILLTILLIVATLSTGCETAMKKTFDRSDMFTNRSCIRMERLSEANTCPTKYELVGQLTLKKFDGSETDHDLCCPELDYFGN